MFPWFLFEVETYCTCVDIIVHFFPFRSLTTDQELSRGNVFYIRLDYQKFVGIGTADNISKYDGDGFTASGITAEGNPLLFTRDKSVVVVVQ